MAATRPKRSETRNLPPGALPPEYRENAAEGIAEDFGNVELARCREAPVEHTACEGVLQDMWRGVHHLSHEEHGEDG